jgi:cytochrome c-type biogenesis protein CcmH/NrfG
MKKKKAILAMLMALAFGFVTGLTTVMLKGGKGSREPMTSQTASPHIYVTREPISIELMEKVEELKETVLENPRNLAAWVRLGDIYSKHNQYREAIEAYSQSLSIRPNDPDIRTNLGLMLRGLGDDDGAIEEFKKAARYNPKHSNSRYYLGLSLLQKKGETHETIKTWEDYLKVEPKGERANQVRSEIERLRAMTAEEKSKKIN